MTPNLNQELWLAERVSKLLSAVFTGDTDIALRKARFRRAILTADLDGAIAGKNAAGATETIGQLFERVYGEPLNLKTT